MGERSQKIRITPVRGFLQVSYPAVLEGKSLRQNEVFSVDGPHDTLNLLVSTGLGALLIELIARILTRQTKENNTSVEIMTKAIEKRPQEESESAEAWFQRVALGFVADVSEQDKEVEV